jgi:hypothetical protein
VTIAEQFTPRRRFTLLLLALLSMLFAPVLLPHELDGVIGPILFTIVLLSALAAVANTRRRMFFATALAIPGCGLMVAASFVHTPLMISASSTVATLFLIYAAAAILDFVFRAHKGGCERDSGVGLRLHPHGRHLGRVLRTDPAALARVPDASPDRVGPRDPRAAGVFQLRDHHHRGIRRDLSGLTLARATAATEALIGQLYLVVLVARLVGLHTAQEARERADKS